MKFRALAPVLAVVLISVLGSTDPTTAADGTATLSVVPHYVDAAGAPVTTAARTRMELHVGESDGVGALGRTAGETVTGGTPHGLSTDSRPDRTRSR